MLSVSPLFVSHTQEGGEEDISRTQGGSGSSCAISGFLCLPACPCREVWRAVHGMGTFLNLIDHNI